MTLWLSGILATDDAENALAHIDALCRKLENFETLRRGSPTYGHARGVELSAQNGRGLYLPTGCAHGFVALSDAAGMYYKVTSVHAPAQDAGIAWDSVDFNWPVDDPALSDRDRRHPRLADFATPFVFDPAQAAR